MIRKKLAFTLTLLSILLVVSATYTPALATTYQLGVQAGNTADYTASVTASSDTKLRLSVRNVTGTTAGVDLTYYFANDTIDTLQSSSHYIDVASTSGSGGSFWIFLIAKNLNNGDEVYPTSGLTLNASTTMIAAGVNRTVERLSFLDNTMYWDKDTGIIVKMNLHFIIWINITMTATNMWPAGGLFGLSTETLLIIGVVGVVVIIAAAVLLMRRRK
jgi:hypothetical protein